MSQPSDPRTDNPVEALIRHNIEVHNSPQVRFLHDLMFALMVLFGLGFVAVGVLLDLSTMFSILSIGMGLFLAAWAPFARRQSVADTARKTAAAQWQLEQVKARRQDSGQP